MIIGNHRDAWGYGAIDPSSGTACLMEISRVLGSLIKDGQFKSCLVRINSCLALKHPNTHNKDVQFKSCLVRTNSCLALKHPSTFCKDGQFKSCLVNQLMLVHTDTNTYERDGQFKSCFSKVQFMLSTKTLTKMMISRSNHA